MSRGGRPPGRAERLALALSVTVLGALVVGGCVSVGPATVPRDRFDYSAAMADSWKHQTLLNIVKLRYMDVPVFLDVAQVVSGYQLQTTVLAGGTASVDPSSVPTIGSFLSLGAQGSYTDRPTIRTRSSAHTPPRTSHSRTMSFEPEQGEDREALRLVYAPTGGRSAIAFSARL
jgi:hypothetical protein